MKKLVPLKLILESAEAEGFDPEDIVCDPKQVHIVERDDFIEPESDIEEPE